MDADKRGWMQMQDVGNRDASPSSSTRTMRRRDRSLLVVAVALLFLPALALLKGPADEQDPFEFWGAMIGLALCGSVPLTLFFLRVELVVRPKDPVRLHPLTRVLCGLVGITLVVGYFYSPVFDGKGSNPIVIAFVVVVGLPHLILAILGTLPRRIAAGACEQSSRDRPVDHQDQQKQ